MCTSESSSMKSVSQLVLRIERHVRNSKFQKNPFLDLFTNSEQRYCLEASGDRGCRELIVTQSMIVFIAPNVHIHSHCLSLYFRLL